MNREFKTARVEDRGEGLLLLTLNRPEVANAMNTQMGRDLLAFFDEINAAPARQKCIVLTGAGERAFCAGGDLKERNGMTDAAWQDQHLLFERMIRAFLGCPVPVIGAINGAAYAGGCELALCCDFIYAAEAARFALTEVTLGIMPGAGIGGTVDCTDDRHRAADKGADHPLEQQMLILPGRVGHAVALFEITPGAKRAFPGTGQHDAPVLRRRGVDLVEEGEQIAPHLGIHRIGDVGPVEGQQ